MNEAAASFINPKDPGRGISLNYNSDVSCPSGGTYSLQLDIRCDEGARHPIPRLSTVTV